MKDATKKPLAQGIKNEWDEIGRDDYEILYDIELAAVGTLKAERFAAYREARKKLLMEEFPKNDREMMDEEVTWCEIMNR